MFNRILFVCTGNICRSAMAEGLLRAEVGDRLEVGSAGIGALLGHPADDHARAVMLEHGIDISAHRARQATQDILRWADLILGMESHHLRGVYDVDPTSRGKAFLMGHWLQQYEIADPYREGREAFEKTMAELERTLATWLPRLK